MPWPRPTPPTPGSRPPAPRAAHALDALHPLLGIPIALKDLVSVAGGQCTAGSRILEGYRAPYDAHITERLRDAGRGHPGQDQHGRVRDGLLDRAFGLRPDRQPVGTRPRPGGSSGGSAAAVAAFHAPVAIGTDTGGSIRQPAALCGIVGLKPTYGRVSRYGIVAFASSLDQIGPFARDARDAAALLHAVAGRDERDSTSSPEPVPATLLRCQRATTRRPAALRGKRLGLPREYFVAGMEPGVEARVREAVAALEAAGAIVEEVSLPHTDYGLATYYIVAPAEASANLARYDGIRYGPRLGDGDVLANYLATRGQGFGPEVKRRIMLGTYALSAGYYDAYYLKAQKVRTLIKGDFDALWAQGFDALVAPTSPTVAFRFGERLADPVVDVPVRRLHAAGQHGRAARRSRSRAACPRACRWACSSSAPPGPRPSCSVWRAATRRSPPTPTGGRSSPPSLPRRGSATPTPPSGSGRRVSPGGGAVEAEPYADR